MQVAGLENCRVWILYFSEENTGCMWGTTERWKNSCDLSVFRYQQEKLGESVPHNQIQRLHTMDDPRWLAQTTNSTIKSKINSLKTQIYP